MKVKCVRATRDCIFKVGNIYDVETDKHMSFIVTDEGKHCINEYMSPSADFDYDGIGSALFKKATLNVIEYADKWDASDIENREKNNREFIFAFIVWAKDKERMWNFHSNHNGYCGYTAEIADSYNPFGSSYRFELAYKCEENDHSDFVKVFTSNHHGFWVPEYIDLKGVNAKQLLHAIKAALLRSSGF